MGWRQREGALDAGDSARSTEISEKCTSMITEII